MSKHKITIAKKTYEYEITPKKNGVSHFVCAAAGIDQDFLNEDIPRLLNDLPELIKNEQTQKQQNDVLTIRIPKELKISLQKEANKLGYKSLAHFIRFKLSS